MHENNLIGNNCVNPEKQSFEEKNTKIVIPDNPDKIQEILWKNKNII